MFSNWVNGSQAKPFQNVQKTVSKLFQPTSIPNAAVDVLKR